MNTIYFTIQAYDFNVPMSLISQFVKAICYRMPFLHISDSTRDPSDDIITQEKHFECGIISIKTTIKKFIQCLLNNPQVPLPVLSIGILVLVIYVLQS